MAVKVKNINEEIRELHDELNNRISKASSLLSYVKHRIEDYSSKRKFAHVVIQGSVGNDLYFPEILKDGIYRVEIDMLFEQDSGNITLPLWIADRGYINIPRFVVEAVPDETVSSREYVKLKVTKFPAECLEDDKAVFFEFDEISQEYYLKNKEYLTNLPSAIDEIKGGIMEEKEFTTDVISAFSRKRPFRSFITEIQQLTTDKETLSYQLLMDKVAAIKVKWPVFAAPWESRERIWPPLDLCKAITQYGIHVIPKASNQSESNVQWKYTFAIAEQRLAHNFTPFQKTCYLILKQLKRRYFSQVSLNDGDVVLSSGINTHHLKTVMFWTSERINPSEWQTNPGKCLSLIVQTLVDFLRTKHCPSYFVPEVNLFERLWNDDNKFLYVRDYHQLRDERIQAVLKLVLEVQSNMKEYITSELLQVVDDDHERAISDAQLSAENDFYFGLRSEMVNQLVSLEFPFTLDYRDLCKSPQEEIESKDEQS